MGSNVVSCELCPHRCVLHEYERGLCRVRINVGGELYSLVYGRPCAVHVDPIEKKPLYHVLPGSRVYSIATAGCCLHCRYCQNWSISQRNPEDVRSLRLEPAELVENALRSGAKSIAYTYTEPTVFYEYVYDTAVSAADAGLLNISVTSAYINKEPLEKLTPFIHAANVDLKGFTEDFYQAVCGGRLRPVLDALIVMKSGGTFVELTNLLVPGLNDDMKVFSQMCDWIVKNLGADTPLHISRFFPQFRLRNLAATPRSTLVEAWKRARNAGLHFVYVGNILVEGGGLTRCPSCDEVLVRRQGFWVFENKLTDGHCPSCNAEIAGIWSGVQKGKN